MTGIAVTLDEASHTYSVGGRPIQLSVTGVLQQAGFVDTSWFTPDAAKKGQAIHQLIERVDAGLEIVDAPEEIAFAEEAWLDFVHDTGWKTLRSEQAIAAPRLGFAGRPDFIGHFPGGDLAILDLKTGQKQKWWPLQTAGYAILVEEEADGGGLYLMGKEWLGVAVAIDRYSLIVRPRGPRSAPYKLDHHTRAERDHVKDIETFHAALITVQARSIYGS